MKDFCNIAENFEGSLRRFSYFIKGYEEKRNQLCIHIEKLNSYIDSLNNEDDKKLILDSVKLLSEELNYLEETSEIVYEIDNYLRILSRQEETEDKLNLERASGVKILEAQEQVRKRIATELHDSAIQSLAGLTYKTELCIKLLEKDPTRVRLELEVILSLLKNIIEDMRNTIYNLRPALMWEGNLDSCIAKYLNNLGIMYPNISFKHEIKGTSKKVREIFELTVLRIIQEACQNAAKHSKAQYIKVEIVYLHDNLLLKIKDNGIGFEPESIKDDGGRCVHFGLSIMQERANLMNAKLDVESSKDKGTVVRVEIPEVYSDEGDNNGSN